MKFLLTDAVAQAVQAWAVEHLHVDAHADPRLGNSYQTTTVYFDTTKLDLFHRAPGFRGRKYRLRRYGQESTVFLERKLRRGDRVRKYRTCVPQHELTEWESQQARADWPGEWFRAKVVQRGLQPTCCVTYERAAFVAMGTAGPLRLTLDRRIRGEAANGWNVSPVVAGHDVMSGEVICEFKFRDATPALFKQVIADLKLQPARVSKYRRLMHELVQAIQEPIESPFEGDTRNA